VQVQIMCYNAVMEACHKAGQWEDALALLTHMRTTGPRPGNAAYSAAMRACLRAKVPEKAMGLLQAMREQEEGQACYGSDGVSYRQDNRPDLATHGLYMRVCASAGHWEEVLTTLQHMRTHGPSPDALCVVHAISALVSCGRVKEAVQVLEESERGVQGAERPRLLAFHVALLGAIDAQDWDSFDAAAAQLQRVEGLLPTPEVTHALLSAGRERGGQGTGEALEPLRQSIAQAAALNPHHPLRRAKVEVLGVSFN
jgi:pentatricopeptide repeat protein